LEKKSEVLQTTARRYEALACGLFGNGSAFPVAGRVEARAARFPPGLP
jgi:hypothetical protein